MVINWPELTRFCMCCNLNVGIYITAGYHSLLLIALSSHDGWQIHNLVKLHSTAWCNTTTNIADIDYRDLLIQQALIHYVTRILLKTVMLVSTFVLVWGMFFDKPKLINLYLKINIPVWVVSTCDLALSVSFMDMALKLILVFKALIYAYQLVAVRSMYRSMIGKSMIYRESVLSLDDRFNDTNTISNTRPFNVIPNTSPTDIPNDATVIGNDNTNNNFDTAQIANFGHCERCNRLNNDEDVRLATIPTSTPVDRGPPLYEEVLSVTQIPKEANLKEEEPIIFDPSQLVARRHPLLVDSGVDTGGSSTGTPRRPNSLPINKEEKKKGTEDSPVIYDPDQLNVGRSPVVEDRAEI